MPILSDLPEDGAKLMLGGYQQDHPLLLIADTQCHIDGRFVDVSGRLLLRHTCAGTGGVSGAPLLIDSGADGMSRQSRSPAIRVSPAALLSS